MSSLVLWQADLDHIAATRPHLFDHLSAPEKERAAQLGRPLDRARFSAGRGLLRELLAQSLNLPAARIAIESAPGGKPFLPDFPDWQFNLAHSGPFALFALARGRAIGVDIERVRPDFAFPLAALAPPERARARDAAALFQLWTFKEAFLKARGCGLRHAPAALDTSNWRDGIAHWDAARGAWQRDAQWQLRPLSTFEGCVAAIAFETCAECDSGRRRNIPVTRVR